MRPCSRLARVNEWVIHDVRGLWKGEKKLEIIVRGSQDEGHGLRLELLGQRMKKNNDVQQEEGAKSLRQHPESIFQSMVKTRRGIGRGTCYVRVLRIS